MGRGVVRRIGALLSSSALVLAGVGAFSVLPAAASSGIDTTPISVDRTATISDESLSSGGVDSLGPESAGGPDSGDAGGVGGASPVNRSKSHGISGEGTSISESGREATNTSQVLSFDGLSHFSQRFANHGRQLSVEPPDQGLCAGNGYVVETVNDVMSVYNTKGTMLAGPTTLNTFYSYKPAIVRGAAPVFGPVLTDPSCYFDSATQRWFHVVLTLETFPGNGRFTGLNHLDLAVSRTADPTGAWNVYQPVYTQDDGLPGLPGLPGTPDHGCSTGPYLVKPTHPNACVGDYPHIGADAYGFYISTNEYSFFGPEFKAAQIYAFSKLALAAGAPTTPTQVDTTGMVGGSAAGFTVWPAESPNGQFNTSANGTEYFLSSNAADEVNPLLNRTSRDLIVWSLTNTESLSSSPALSLTNSVLKVGRYAAPPPATQKVGPTPLADCLNDTSLAIPVPVPGAPPLLGCWRLAGIPEPTHNQVEGMSIDTNDTRMQQVMLAGGMLYGALDTAVKVRGKNEAGIEWFEVAPPGGDDARVVKQGYFGAVDANVSYPALAVNENGLGAMAFSLSGPNDYPSAAYTSFDAKSGTGDIHIAGVGQGPEDGYTAYATAFGGPPGSRTRWGDYGAAVVDGSNVWVASEYIAHSCSFADFTAPGVTSPAFGTCSGTRSPTANWATRITELAVGS